MVIVLIVRFPLDPARGLRLIVLRTRRYARRRARARAPLRADDESNK